MRYGEIVTPNEPLAFGWIKAASNLLVISTPGVKSPASLVAFDNERFAFQAYSNLAQLFVKVIFIQAGDGREIGDI